MFTLKLTTISLLKIIQNTKNLFRMWLNLNSLIAVRCLGFNSWRLGAIDWRILTTLDRHWLKLYRPRALVHFRRQVVCNRSIVIRMYEMIRRERLDKKLLIKHLTHLRTNLFVESNAIFPTQGLCKWPTDSDIPSRWRIAHNWKFGFLSTIAGYLINMTNSFEFSIND